MQRILSGGIFAEKWITIYAEALRMSTQFGKTLWCDDESSSSENFSPPRNTAKSSHTEVTGYTMGK